MYAGRAVEPGFRSVRQAKLSSLQLFPTIYNVMQFVGYASLLNAVILVLQGNKHFA